MVTVEHWKGLVSKESEPDAPSVVEEEGDGGVEAVSYTHLTLPTTPYV